MTDAIFDIVFLTLMTIGYVLVIFLSELFYKHGNKFTKLCRKWFFLTQGSALLLVIYMMTTERNQIPVIGYLILLMASLTSGTFMLGGFSIDSKERTHQGRKLLKMSYWIFGSVVLLSILWVIIWWKELFG